MQLQGTEAWKKDRRGKFTSSCVWKLMTDPKGKTPLEKWNDAWYFLRKWQDEYDILKNKETKTAKEKLCKIESLRLEIPKLEKERDTIVLSETAKTYVLEKIVEEVGGFLPEGESKATDYGTNQESEARYWYEKKTLLETQQVGFIPYNESFGGSPDSQVLDRETDEIGVLEIKCPYNSVNHLKHRLIDSEEYFKENHFDFYWQCMGNMLATDSQWCDFVSFDGRIDHEIGLFIFRLKRNESDIIELKERIKMAEDYKQDLKIQLGLI
jgi:hypothetical protein